MNGEWIWILLALFGIFRLLMLAGKKKGEGARPERTGPERETGSSPGDREEVDELKMFIDSLSRQFGPAERPPPPPPPPPPQVRPRPPSPERSPARPRTADRPRPAPRAPAPRPERVSPGPERLPGRAGLSVPTGPPRPGFLRFSDHPVVQGIVFSEILGPPRGLGGGNPLPGDRVPGDL